MKSLSILNKKEVKKALPNITILFDEPLKNHTFAKVGGKADALVFPKSAEEIETVLTFIRAHMYPVMILGNASNIIVRDGGIRGFVLMLTQMNEAKVVGTKLYAQAGATIKHVAKVALSGSLTGLEFACGIPGSVGGAVVMNAGAYGGEIAGVFTSAQVLHETGEIEKMTCEQMDFGYRHSILQEIGGIVLSVEFELANGNLENIQAEMLRLTELREAKQPLEYPSCGSVFKRPPGYYAGKLIQDAGMQGVRVGGAQVSEKHAGFMVNRGGATASDYEELIQKVIDGVKEHSGVTLETEVRIIGEK